MFKITKNSSQKSEPVYGKRKDFVQQVYSRLSEKIFGKKDYIASFEYVQQLVRAKNRVYLGLMEIEVDKIIGSEGRFTDFEKGFLPIRSHVQQHVAEMERLYNEGYHFPPISVYKIDEFFFVRDGNHRVAAAKVRGQIFIDAEITELESPVPITKDLTKFDCLLIEKHVHFLNVTGLDAFGRDANINLSKPVYYQQLLGIIFKYTKTENLNPEKPEEFKQGANFWYRKVFLPFAEDAYRYDLLARFPKKTTGDLYVWVQSNWHKLKKAKETAGLDYLSSSFDNQLPEDPISNREIKLFREVIHNNLKVEDNFLLHHHIGLTIVNLIFYLQEGMEPKIIIVKRRYHPSERRWSLPIAMLRPEEEFVDASFRCQRNVLGLSEMIPMTHFCTHDSVARYPFGRCIGVGMLGFLVEEKRKVRFSAGHISDKIDICLLKNVPGLVFDHSVMVRDALEYITKHANDREFICKNFEEGVSIGVIDEFFGSIEGHLKTLKENHH